MTTLTVGMAQLLMPAFAGERIEAPGPGSESWLSWPGLVSATALRVAGAGLTSQPRATLIALSGLLAWVGLVAFAAGLLRASLSQQPRYAASSGGGA